MHEQLVTQQITLEERLEQQEKETRLLQALLVWHGKQVDCSEFVLGAADRMALNRAVIRCLVRRLAAQQS